MIKYVIILSFTSILLPVYSAAQCLSIELSIEWKYSKNDFLLKELNKNDSVCNPYLQIKYRNNSDKDVYFLKPTDDYPDILSTILMNSRQSMSEKARNYGDYSGKKYTVGIGFYISYYPSPWELFRGFDNQDSIATAISYNLSNIYWYLKNKTQLINKDSSRSSGFNSADINAQGILGKLKHKFLFLNKGETYTESFDLLGFYLVKGSFCFEIKIDTLPGFVYTAPQWNNVKEMWTFPKAKLPEKVDNYFLYNSKIHSNKVILEIE